jgi:hypothetical protein
MDKGTAFRQIVLIGVNNLCRSVGRTCTQQKRRNPFELHLFDSIVERF